MAGLHELIHRFVWGIVLRAVVPTVDLLAAGEHVRFIHAAGSENVPGLNLDSSSMGSEREAANTNARASTIVPALT